MDPKIEFCLKYRRRAILGSIPSSRTLDFVDFAQVPQHFTSFPRLTPKNDAFFPFYGRHLFYGVTLAHMFRLLDESHGAAIWLTIDRAPQVEHSSISYLFILDLTTEIDRSFYGKHDCNLQEAQKMPFRSISTRSRSVLETHF